MTTEIFEKAQILADAISRSAELANLRITEKDMLADDEAQRIIGEFQTAQQRLADMQKNNQDLNDEDKQQVALIEDQVEHNALISAYLSAQDKFTQMLDGVNALLAQAIAGQSDGCASCQAGSGCGEDGCGGH